MTARRFPGVVLLASWLLLGGCNVNDFNELERGKRDAQGGDAGSSARAGDAELGGGDGAAAAADASIDGASNGTLDGAADGDVGRGVADGGDARSPRDAEPEAGGDAGAGCSRDAGVLRVGRFIELARMREAALTTRRLGPSAWLGSRRVWLFYGRVGAVEPPDPAPPANAPGGYPVAALEGADRPWSRGPSDAGTGWNLEETLTASGAVAPFLTLRPDEGTDVGLAPYSVIRNGDDVPGGVAFVLKNVGWINTEVWLADVADGASVAQRRAAPLFRSSEGPLFAHGAHRGATYVKVFACTGELRNDLNYGSCIVARVPRDQVDQRSAYQVRAQRPDGSWDWDNDLTKGTRVIEDVGGDLSVSWNEYLQKFLAVHSGSLGGPVILQTADAVEGPWTKVAEVALPAPPAYFNFGAREHASVVQSCGTRIIVSYFEPKSMTATTPAFPSGGQAVLGAIDLQ
jgi:hypothetical protein